MNIISDQRPISAVSEPLVAASMQRACLFSFYDEKGIVDDYVVFFLKELGKFVQTIIFYSNGPLAKKSELALQGVVSEVVLRPNVGFDVLAYKEGLEKIDFDRNGLYDEVLMVNHTCFGPLYPFSELFTEMESRVCDFWGVTAHLEVTPNPFTGSGSLPYHLNANFIAVRRNMLQSQSFRQYWQAIDGGDTYVTAVLGHEALFTAYFVQLGYVCDTYIDCKKYGSPYPAMYDIDETLIDRSPLLKRRAFFNDPRFLEPNAVDLPRALQILKKTSTYDPSLIWRNIVRSAELRNLNTNAGLTSVLPDVRLKPDSAATEYGRIAVCVHVFYTDMLDEILALTDTIPCTYDFIATTETETKKAFIEQAVRGRKNVGEVIVRIVEQNRGRDMSSLFITCRDLFIGERYDLVCRLHTKKSPQVAAGKGNLFKRHMFENLLNSPGYTTNVLDMFNEHPWIGVAVPPLVHIAYPTMGKAWFANRPKADEVAKLLDLSVPFDPDTPVGAFGTMFWFRPKALHKLFEHPWKWTDFNAEPKHVDGGLAHVMERLICYVAQDAGYATQQIINSHLAGWNYAMLEYKLQKLSAALPNANFNTLARFLEEWQKAGYRHIHNAESARPPEQVLSVRQAFGELMLSSKWSITHRFPFFAKVLRPLYRGMRGPRHELLK